VYDGTGSTLDAQNGSAVNISINASYVIVRGFTLKGAQQHGILIDKNQHDVIIEDNDISGWGRTRDGTWGTDMDSGIRAVCTTPTLQRVTIQRNRIHDPRWSANSWSALRKAARHLLTSASRLPAAAACAPPHARLPRRPRISRSYSGK